MEIFLNPIFSCVLGGGIIFILVGKYMKKHPPKNINSLYGYRTPSSMQSQERWDFAQNYGAKQMIKTGFYQCFSAIIGLLILLLVPVNMTASIIIFVAETIFWSAFLIINTERALRNRFGK